jgi:hypothetical protein
MEVPLSPELTRWSAPALVVGFMTSLLPMAIDSAAFAQAPGAQPRTSVSQGPELIYSPWKKFCLKRPDATAQQICFTGKDGQVASGEPPGHGHGIAIAVHVHPRRRGGRDRIASARPEPACWPG